MNAQIAKADAEICPQKSAEITEKRIREITANAGLKWLPKCRMTWTKDIVAAFDMKADARSVTAAVKAQMKEGMHDDCVWPSMWPLASGQGPRALLRLKVKPFFSLYIHRPGSSWRPFTDRYFAVC